LKLHTNSASPFGRKVAVVAIETGLIDRIEIQSHALTPVQPNPQVTEVNPLGKIPCLVTDDGLALYDSRVICEYLDSLHDGPRLFPEAAARWPALALQALGDGILDAAVGTRYETFLRPEPQRWPDWIAGQKRKIARTLDRLEAECASFPQAPHIGTLTLACALGYLDFRYADDGWRAGRKALDAWYAAFSRRPSLERTRPS
jgi:glutathione S-transferase